MKDISTLEGRLVSLQVGKARKLVTVEGREWRSAIVKESVEGRVALGMENVAGDIQANRQYHGGPEKAACAYCVEHYPVWNEEMALPLPYGAFGENLSVEGLTEEQVCIGDVFTIGTAVIQISQPRIPCAKVDNRWNRPGFHDRMTERGWTGYYLRVRQTGEIAAGDAITLIERPHPEWTLRRANDVIYDRITSPEAIEDLYALPALSHEWKRVLNGKR